MSKVQCKILIDFFERSEQVENSRGYLVVYSNISNPTTVFVRDNIKKNIREYANKHEFLKKLYAPWGISSRFHIQKYLPGNSYSGEHMEHGKHEWDCRRIMGWMFYLNDIKHKGGTCWPQQKFTSTPRAGDLYIWPAGWTHSHYGIPAPKETKYLATGWCSFHGFTNTLHLQ